MRLDPISLAASAVFPWFVSPQVNGEASHRLFFFPYAGSGPAAFGKWCTELPRNLDGWIAHYPGRGSRFNEPPLRKIESLVENLALAIQPLLDKPFAFFGHSMGGLVAFELARRLRQRGLPGPAVLFVSACRAPHLPDEGPSIHSLPDAEFFTELEKLNGIPREILQTPKALELMLPSIRADFEIVENYDHTLGEPLHCPIMAFGGLDDPHVRREQVEAWAVFTGSDFDAQFFEGDHFFLNVQIKPMIDLIVRRIESSITGNRRAG